MENKLVYKFEQVQKLVKMIDDSELNILSTFLSERLKQPDSYVVLLGETSSGKSTLINGLVGETLLYVSAAPATSSITEVIFQDESKKNEYLAINKDGKMEVIDQALFINLTKKPDDELERLRIITKAPTYKFDRMRLFDTPGYGSIISKHEEILKNFIPNSDVIIYVVGYRIGIQENDYLFLRFLKELIRENVEIILAINRCPINIDNNDKRIIEIRKYVHDLLHEDIPCFLLENTQNRDQNDYPLPQDTELWNHVETQVNSEKRRHLLNEAFNEFILDLYRQCENEINQRYAKIKISFENKKKLAKIAKEHKQKINKIITELIEPEFSRIISKTEKLIDAAKDLIYQSTADSIDSQKTVKMDETITYVNNHLLPYNTQQEIKEIEYYLEIELNKLNNKVDEMLNTEIIKFQNDIKILFSSAIDETGKGILKSLGSSSLKGGLMNYFSAFGGAGGAGAGIANAASHGLKVAGDFFGKTFSRETHNALKHVLKKIGATSTKSIGVAVAVIMECLTVVYEANTWKTKLKKKVKQGTEEWHKEAKPTIIKDLVDLKLENIRTLNEIMNANLKQIDLEGEIPNEKKTMELLSELSDVREKIGA